MSTCLLNFYPIIKLDQFELNNYFQSTSYFSSLFNQLSLLSDTAATITAFQHARDVTSPANYLMAAHAAITENLFTVATVIITVTMLGYLYKNTSRVAVSFATKITQLFFYLFLIILLQLALALALVENVGELLKVNFFESLLALIVLFLLTILASTDLISIRSFEVPILLYLVACFGWTLLNANDFGLFIICIEGFSLTLYILATVSRTFGGVVAATKYFTFGTLGSLLLYWGAINMFEVATSLNIDLFTNIITYEGKELWVQSLVLSGLLIKLGAAPFHQWVADVYAGAPMLITAFYSTFVKFVLFLLFIQFAINFASASDIEYAALLSMIVGCFVTLRQTDIKRFLAWGSITHTGYLLAGDATASYTYMVTYALASITFFSVILLARFNLKELTYLSDLQFLGKKLNAQRLVLLVALSSMAGLPPFAGFYGKLFVWSSLAEDSYLYNEAWSFILFVVGILTSLIVMFYYIYVMYILFIGDETVNSATISSQATASQISGHPASFAIKYSQMIGSASLVLLTFVIYNLLQFIL